MSVGCCGMYINTNVDALDLHSSPTSSQVQHAYYSAIIVAMLRGQSAPTLSTDKDKNGLLTPGELQSALQLGGLNFSLATVAHIIRCAVMCSLSWPCLQLQLTKHGCGLGLMPT